MSTLHSATHTQGESTSSRYDDDTKLDTMFKLCTPQNIRNPDDLAELSQILTHWHDLEACQRDGIFEYLTKCATRH